jgi:prolyl-tRNA synthetase
MKLSNFYLNTLKEAPQEAQLISHQLMLRANMIKQTASGIYTWLPLGLRVLRKVENIVREEMNKAGAIELSMPMTQPAELWQESGRWQDYGPELLRFKDRHQRDFCLGPTHEEIISDIIRQEIHSYRQLPLNLYQIQTKFRDEVRPRFGVMRSREFLMKDAYSFHTEEKSLVETYNDMAQAYRDIFTRIGLDFRAVSADSGSIGGDTSQEFHVLANSGEDALAFSDNSDYCANVELAESICLEARPEPTQSMELQETPNVRTIKQVSQLLDIPETQCVKLLLVKGTQDDAIALILRGDHQLNEIKAEKHPLIATPLSFVEENIAEKIFNCRFGSLGPVGITIPLIVDNYAAQVADFCCGANQQNHHYIGVNWGRDLPQPETYDLRTVEQGDPSPDGKGKINIRRGIEVGHVFQLGKKYSDAMKLTIQNKEGEEINPYMGCYGIGVSRIVAASIEQNNDQRGIIWRQQIAPFDLHIVLINPKNNPEINALIEQVETLCQQHHLEVITDDRPLSPGNKFADADLIGCPHRLVIGEKGLKNGELEYKARSCEQSDAIPLDNWQEKLITQITPNSAK